MIKRFLDAWGPQQQWDSTEADKRATPSQECCWNCQWMVNRGRDDQRVEHGWVWRIMGHCQRWSHSYTRARACDHNCTEYARREGDMKEYRIKMVTVEVEQPMWVEVEA